MASFLRAARALLRFPFRDSRTAPLWFALRLYLASVWLRFGLSKLEAGWLEHNSLGGLLGMVAAGELPSPFPFYAGFVQLLLDLGLDAALSFLIPILELGIALALFTGFLWAPATVLAIALNLNFLLSGVASLSFDGGLVVLQSLLLLAGPVAGRGGLPRLFSSLGPPREGGRRAESGERAEAEGEARCSASSGQARAGSRGGFAAQGRGRGSGEG